MSLPKDFDTEATTSTELRRIVAEIGDLQRLNTAKATELEYRLWHRVLVLIAMAGSDYFEGGPRTLEDVIKLARIALLTDRFPFPRWVEK